MTAVETANERAAKGRVTQRPLLAWLALATRLLTGGVMLYAGLPKLFNAATFVHLVNGYDLLPDWGVMLAATTLPWVETIAGALLILGVWTRGSALVVTLLLITFTAATSSAVVRGLDISCGCFSLERGSTVTWGQVALHATLLIPSLYILAAGAGRLALDNVSSRVRSTG